MTLKLKYTNIGLVRNRIESASDTAFMLKAAENHAQVTIESHGRQINDLIWLLESALSFAQAFRNEVKER